MFNDSKNQVSTQRKTRRNQHIELEKIAWAEHEKQLAQKKTDLGYSDHSWDDFLAVVPDPSIETALQSSIISLQKQYAELLERWAIIWAEDIVIDEFNKIHAVIHIDQTFILTEKINTLGNQDFSLEGRQSFKTYYEDEEVECLNGVWRCKADIWLKSPNRRKYKGIIFDPTTTEHLNGYYNLWRGFTRTPKQGDCSLYWAHVRENICSGDAEKYRYLRKWVAYVFQYPDQVHAAIVLCGSQGTGKNSFVNPLGVLFGAHYTPMSSISELTSNFNYHQKNAVLIHANEALWGGNKKEIGTVKAMITEHTCLIEGKGKDRIVVRNFKHIILSSNESWPVHLDPDDRRFVVINVSEIRKEDHAYFHAIREQLEHEGYEALLYDLLHEDLTQFDPRRLPSVNDAFDIKMRSADSAHRYLFEVLNLGGFSIGTDATTAVWQGPIPKESVYDDYIAWCQKNGEIHIAHVIFGKIVKKLIASVEDTRPSSGSRQRCYQFPSLQQAREDFCTVFKENPQHIFNHDIYDGTK